MGRPYPPAVKAMQASLQRAREPELRARLERSLLYLKGLYGLPERRHEDTGDMRRGYRPRSPSAITRW